MASHKIDWNANKDLIHKDTRKHVSKMLAAGELVPPCMSNQMLFNSDGTVTHVGGNLLGTWSEMTKTDAAKAAKAAEARNKAEDAKRVAAEHAAKADADFRRTMAEMDLESE